MKVSRDDHKLHTAWGRIGAVAARQVQSRVCVFVLHPTITAPVMRRVLRLIPQHTVGAGDGAEAPSGARMMTISPLASRMTRAGLCVAMAAGRGGRRGGLGPARAGAGAGHAAWRVAACEGTGVG